MAAMRREAICTGTFKSQPRFAALFVTGPSLNHTTRHRAPHSSQRRITMATSTALQGKRVLVTGASRGIGRGIAIGLGEHAATVYITGRRKRGSDDALEETAVLVRAAGGTCETFAVDHSDDISVETLFTTIRQRLDSDGVKLDVLVNNAYAAVDFLMKSGRHPTWRKNASDPATVDDKARPGEAWDIINRVGLRNNFICSAYAMRQFAVQKSGIVVNVSSYGGIFSIFDGVYGTGKAAIDRLSAELAKEAPPGVTCLTVLAGTLARPQLVQSMHGKIVIAAEVAPKIGAKDENGNVPISMRSVRFAVANAMPALKNSVLLRLVPNFYIPLFVLQLSFGLIKFW
eukprot:IDg8892t1